MGRVFSKCLRNLEKKSSSKSQVLNQSVKFCTQESQEDLIPTTPTIAPSDFKTPDPTRHYFSPNPSETKNQKTPSPDDIFSEVSLKDIKTYGLSKEKVNKLVSRSPIRDKFKGWKMINEICSGLDVGCYLIENYGYYDKNLRCMMKHCTALYVTDTHYEYFDSMGTPLRNDLGIPVINNLIQFQYQVNNTCSLHAVNFLIERDKLGTMKKLQESYPSDKTEFLFLNEEHVYKNIKPKEPDKHSIHSQVLSFADYV